VEMSVPPVLEPVPSAVGICAYRIVQESLSNASRHAQGAAVTVSMDHRAGDVVLQVANGPGPVTGTGPSSGTDASGEASVPPGAGHAPGHGLLGMRERVALLGGSLSAGPSADGGFVVSAVLPLAPAV
jgi:signal transduction histidine kinase